MRSLIFKALALCVCGLAISACEEEIDDADIAQFNQPQDVALVCFDNKKQLSLPIDSCRNSERTDAEVYAFVTQTQYGEVAVVNLEDYKIIDQEKRIPFNSFVPVGGQPQDIAASADGTKIYTANFGTRDISVIDVKTAIEGSQRSAQEGPLTLGEMARTVNLDYAPIRILIASEVSGAESQNSTMQGNFAFVAQPTVGRVAVVCLSEYEYTDATGNTYTIPEGVVGWVRLDDSTLNPDSDVVDERPEGISPIAMVASKKTSSLYVGAQNGGVDGGGGYVAEIQREIFVDRAIRAFVQNGQASALAAEEVMVRRMDTDVFTVRDMSIEPELERWMYIVERELGGVIVLDLQTGELVEVNSWDWSNSNQPYSIEVPGIARKVQMVRFSESLASDEYPGPATFNGTFALVSTTHRAIYVVDVAVDDDLAAEVQQYTSYPHTLRSGNDWYDDDGKLIYPEVPSDPQLRGDDDSLNSDNPFQELTNLTEAAVAANPAVDPCVNNPEGFRMVQVDDGANVYFRCDRRLSSQESWTLTYEGEIGISGAGIWDDSLSVPGESIVLHDEYKRYCESGLLGPAGPYVWDIYPENQSAGVYEKFRNYRGDLLEVTSEPSPFNPATNCSMYENDDLKKLYQITEVIDEQTIRIQPIDVAPEVYRTLYAPLPTKECFSQVVSYRIRANDSWVLSGSQTRVQREGSMENGHCVPWEQRDSKPWKTSRVFESTNVECVQPEEGDKAVCDKVEDLIFENQFLRFRLGTIDDDLNGKSKASYDKLSFSFVSINGYTPMSAPLGADITDIDVAPNNDLVIVDQSRQGMLLFDLIDAFEPVNDDIIN